MADNVIGVTTAGSLRLFINQDGDIALGTDTVRNGAKLNVKNDTQVVATFECQNADPQIYIGDNMASTDNNTLVIGYDRQDNRGYLTIASDSDLAGINIGNTGSVGIGTASDADKLEVFGAIRSLTSSSNFASGDESTVLDVDYCAVKRIRLVKPTLKRYLAGKVKSRFRRIDADEFIVATLLPVARWSKAEAAQVHKDSRGMF